MDHLKITSPESFVVGTGALSSFISLPHHAFLQCSSSKITLSSTANKSSKTTFEVKFCCNISMIFFLPLVKILQQELWNQKQSILACRQ
jgi:hypothetical protein